VKAAASTMRPKAGLDIETAITELAVGEALVSLLDAKGRPSETERVYVLLPGSQLGPISDMQRQALILDSLVAGIYDTPLDRESAYELLVQQNEQQGTNTCARSGAQPAANKQDGGLLGEMGSAVREALFGRTGPRGGQYDGLVQNVVKGEVRRIGRELLRGALGSLLGGSKRR